LIVCGEEFDGAVRQRAQLHARAQQILADDAFLHDAAVGFELGHVSLEPSVRRLQLHSPDAFCDRRASVRRWEICDPDEIDECIAGTGDSIIEFHDHLAHTRSPGQKYSDRVDDIVETVQILGAERIRHADFAEKPSAAGLGSKTGQARVCTVHRDAEGEGDVTFELGRVVRDQVAVRPVRNQRGDSGEHPGPLEQLLAQRPRRRIAHRHHREPGQGMTRNDSGKQSEVVLDDRLFDGHRGHVDHPQPRLAQQQEEEEETLFERLSHAAATRNGRPQRDRRHDNDRLVVEVELHRTPHRSHAVLQHPEPGAAGFAVEVGQGRGRVSHRRALESRHVLTSAFVSSIPVTSNARIGRLKPLNSSAPTGLPDATPDTMIAINRHAERAPFLTLFFGSAVASAAVIITSAADPEPASALRITGGALSLAGVVSTIVVNVPLNRRLASAGAKRAASWADFDGMWSRWNLVRAVLSVVGAIALLVR
jgi:uncharacterized membrane protein